MKNRWGILVAACFGVFASFASIFIFSFSVFLKPLESEFGWSRTQISLGFSLAAMTVACCSPFIGRLVDRHGSRAVILPACAVFGAAFASLGWLTPNLFHFYAVVFAIGLVGNGTTQLAFSRAVVEAFDARRGMALAAMMTGTGLGSIFVPPLTQAGIDHLGWRATYQIFGFGILCTALPLTALLIPRQAGAVVKERRRGFPPALRSRLLWLLLAAFFLMSLAVNATLAHLSPLLTDRGITPQAAALAASVLGAASLGGRLLTGWALDRWPAARVGGLLFGCGAAGVLGLALGASNVWAFVSVAFIGAAMGAEADVIPYLISRHFDLSEFGELYGLSFTSFAIAGALGPLIMGRAFDLAGSYDPVLGGLAAAALGAALLISRTPHVKT